MGTTPRKYNWDEIWRLHIVEDKGVCRISEETGVSKGQVSVILKKMRQEVFLSRVREERSKIPIPKETQGEFDPLFELIGAHGILKGEFEALMKVLEDPEAMKLGITIEEKVNLLVKLSAEMRKHSESIVNIHKLALEFDNIKTFIGTVIDVLCRVDSSLRDKVIEGIRNSKNRSARILFGVSGHTIQ